MCKYKYVCGLLCSQPLFIFSVAVAADPNAVSFKSLPSFSLVMSYAEISIVVLWCGIHISTYAKTCRLNSEVHVKLRCLTGRSASQSAVLIIGSEEAGGAAAVIRAFWCGLAERKGHPLNDSGRTTGREGEG